jgi:plasmid stabilization system protein ParE
MQKYKFETIDDVDTEIANAIKYCQKRFGKTTAIKFMSAIEITEALLEEHPGLAKVYEDVPGIYKRSIPHFPYTFYIAKNNNEYKIVALVFRHQSQDPKELAKLIKLRLRKENLATKSTATNFTLPPHQAKSFYAKTTKTTKPKTNNNPNVKQNHNRGLIK